MTLSIVLEVYSRSQTLWGSGNETTCSFEVRH